MNSAYPDAMLNDHPHGFSYSTHHNIPKKQSDIQKSFITLTCESRGAFPIREKIDNQTKLVFPDDGMIREFFVTGWEYLAAKDTGALANVNVIDVKTANKTINFKKFIIPHYLERLAAKKRNDKILDLAHKYFMNSGYGKYALDPRDFKDYALVDIGDASPNSDGYNYECDITDDICLWAKNSFDGNGFYDVATAASITGFVRAKLWRAMNFVGLKNVAYLDTDSLLLLPGCELVTGEGLGEWKYEGVANYGANVAKKLYAWRGNFGNEKEKIACKGVNLSFSEIMKVAKGETIEWKNDSPAYKLGKNPQYVRREVSRDGVKRRKKT